MLARGGVDQTLVGQLISAGQITAEEARQHAYSAVGLTPDVGMTTSTFGLRNNDWLLLCTDGIWRLVRDELIEETIRGADSPLEVVTRPKSRAIEYGGPDNLSILNRTYKDRDSIFNVGADLRVYPRIAVAKDWADTQVCPYVKDTVPIFVGPI